MPFKDQYKMDNRRDFVLRAKGPGVNFRALCREFGISAPTGYKWVARFDARGLAGLEEMGRGPRRGRRLRCSPEVALEVVRLRREKPTWGATKIVQVLARTWPVAELPTTRTFWRVLERAGLASTRRTRRRKGVGPAKAPGLVVEAANELWTVDFKGWWRTKDGRKCEPLTVRDAFSKFILCIELVERPTIEEVRAIFERLFETYGLPRTIQSDNGSPFATTQGLCGLTKLSAWWRALGIEVVRSRVGCPQDNGGHERMHRDMAAELERQPAWTREDQKRHCALFREEFNQYRPHQALGGETPGSVYQKSARVYAGPPPQPVYPEHMEVRRVSSCGAVRYAGEQRSLSQALAGYDVGFEYLGKQKFRVWFGTLCLGEGYLPWKAPIHRVTLAPADPE